MVLITGGTGSFGKKCVQILLKEYPIKRLVIYSRDELKQEEMRTMQGFRDERLRYFIGDIRDKERLERALVDIDIVIHAAALKQVASCEYNPIEAIRTNITGAENLVNACINRSVQKVVALSSDKAVSPVNLYGATKLVAEKLFVQGNNYSSRYGTKFACVRYGNVVGSRGSVVPLFLHQKKTGLITLTDTQMTRFWLTLEQGVRFVIRSAEQMKGGEIFIHKIPSMKITDLAGAVAPGVKVKIIGVRPGEKIFETLISENEAPNTYEFKDMFVIKPNSLFREQKSNLWSKGKKMKQLKYDSNINTQWITSKQLTAMVDKMKL